GSRISAGAGVALNFRRGLGPSIAVAVVMSIVIALGTALLVDGRHRIARVGVFAALFGVAAGALPVALGIAADVAGIDEIGGTATGRVVAIFAAVLASAIASGLAFGAMLATIARLGLNFAQPFAALGDPGYKHFVRMRVREAAGRSSVVDAFVIGVVDPVGKSAPVLVDTFRFGG
ncbi:MAG: hypothetical protein ACREJ3_14375, partial [Polyangiaceae bacterium]